MTKMLLPNYQALVDNGYKALTRVMERLPSRFAHIPQHKRQRRAAEWIPVVERIIGTTGRKPTCRELRAMGLIALYRAMRKHPRVFKHLWVR